MTSGTENGQDVMLVNIPRAVDSFAKEKFSQRSTRVRGDGGHLRTR